MPEFPDTVHPEDDLRPVGSGKYRTPVWFSIPFAFETDRTFAGVGLDDSTGELFALVQGASSGVTFFAVDPAYSLDETISLLRSTPGVEVGPSQPVEVLGLAGTQFDMVGDGRVPAISTLVGHPVFSETDHWLIAAHTYVRYVVVEVHGRVLLIEISAPDTQFEAFSLVVAELLQTVEFLPASD